MTPVRILALIIITLFALSAGWLVDQPTLSEKNEPLIIPDNIDYYLSAVNYHVMNSEGTSHYRLRSPYLEHFIREDVSHIQHPDIDYNSDSSKWVMRSVKGLLQHQSEILELNQQAVVFRIDSDQPVKLASEKIILIPDADLIKLPEPLTLTSNELFLEADSAQMDLKTNLYQFQQVRATYQPKPARTDQRLN